MNWIVVSVIYITIGFLVAEFVIRTNEDVVKSVIRAILGVSWPIWISLFVIDFGRMWYRENVRNK